MSDQNKSQTILVVDDEPEMRGLLVDYLHDVEGYSVLEAENGKDALDNVLPKHHVDLVLSDINMPVMKGFELLRIVREEYPDIKRVLITAYDVEDYLELAMKHDVGNLLVKSVPLNTKELTVILRNLLNGDIFGPEKYFSHTPSRREFRIRRGDRLEEEVKQVVACVPPQFESKRLELVALEMLTNAIFYGIRKESADDRENWVYDFELPEEMAIVVSVYHDDEQCAVTVVDNGGRLTKSDVLYWLYRQLTPDNASLPIGMFDEHGRGFFIARRYVDRVIINVEREKKTEIILMNYASGTGGGYKPLYINEI